MKSNISGFFIAVITIVLISACGTLSHTTQTRANISALKLLGEYDIPYNLKFDNTTVGGLSGIDYAAKYNRYVLISDEILGGLC